MKQIEVQDEELDRLFIYRSIMQILADVKLTQGPIAVTSTLKRHKTVAQFLFDFQKERILELESKLDLHSPEGD